MVAGYAIGLQYAVKKLTRPWVLQASHQLMQCVLIHWKFLQQIVMNGEYNEEEEKIK